MTTDHPYSSFLNGWNPDTDELSHRALNDVKASGLSPDILERAQVTIFSGKTDTLKGRLGFAQVDGAPILKGYRLIEFPYFDATGKITRYEYKPFPSLHLEGEDKPRKYLQAKGEPPTPYILPDVWAAKDRVNKPLWITEGVKKVLVLLQHGRLPIGLSGVWNFRAGKATPDEESTYLWADLEAFRWMGRTVHIGFDADLWTNPMVRRALYELAFKLHCAGAVVRFPSWGVVKGIDDYLVLQEHPESSLARFEEESQDLEAFLTVFHRNEIIAALNRTIRGDGLNEKTLISLVAKKLGLKTKDLERDITRQRNAESKRSVDNSLYPYFMKDGCACMWKRERDGTEVSVELANFIPRIVGEVTVDTGMERTLSFVIEGARSDRAFPRIRVPASQFKDLDWVMAHWGNEAIIRAGHHIREYEREFIQVYSDREGVEKRTVYGHTGWREINGSWCYLMANGAIGGKGIEVELPPEFLEAGRYCLPAVCEKDGKAIGNALHAFINVGKLDISVPALAYVFLSPLTSLLEPMPSFSLYLHGERDTFKTAFAILMLAFFGSHTKKGLSNFDSTANAVMHRAAVLKDTLMVVDDYYPSPRQKEAMQKESIVQRLIRDAGNRTGRGRLNADSSEKPIPVPMGMIVITGEEVPGIQSTLARLVTLELNPGDILSENLTALQDLAEVLPHAMTSYILWVRERIPGLQEAFRVDLRALRERKHPQGMSKKIPEHIAYLWFAWKTFLTWACEEQAITEAFKQMALDQGRDIFAQLAARQGQRVQDEDPIEAFFDILRTLITQGKVRLDDKEKGYEGRRGGDAGELIGYYDENYYYLLPVAPWHAVQTFVRMEGGYFPSSKTTFYDTLERRGYIEVGRTSTMIAQRINGKVQKVLKLKRDTIDLFGERTEETGTDEN